MPDPVDQVEVLINKHVFRFETSARIRLLAMLLEYEDRFRVLCRKYPVEITGDDFRAVLHAGSKDGFTIDGWIEALWASL